MVRGNIFLVSAIFVALFSLTLVSAAFTINSVTPAYANRTVNTLVNFTINNSGLTNITQITITLPMETTFYADSNGTDAPAGSWVFNNATAGPNKVLIWANISQDIFFPNKTAVSAVRSFWFNVSLRNLGNVFFTNFTVTAKHTSGADVTLGYDFKVNFAFSGYVKNETGGNESNVNLTIYRFAEGQGGPPTETYEASIFSDSDGLFSFPNINGSASMYTLKMIRYGPASGCRSANASCNATKVGSSLPSFPAMMYYPTSVDNPAFEFMRPPSLNGTTFYLQPAATLRLYTNNCTGVLGCAQQKFGYQVVDQIVGFPTSSNFMAGVSTVDVVVPVDRNFTVMVVRTPSVPGASFGFDFSPDCNGLLMNDTTCPTPPVSNSSIGTLTAGQIMSVNQSLVVSQYRLAGCINIASNQNNSNLNITKIALKMIPWPGFVPPMRADMGDLDITSGVQLNYSVGITPINCTGSLAYYNISLMGSTAGLNYLLEVYAKNSTANTQTSPEGAWDLAAFQNLTITNHTFYNLSLVKLTGSYIASGDVNTSKIKINIQNSSGAAITNNMNANVKVKNPVFGTMSYMIESMSSGTFYISVLNNSNWAKVMVYANDAPPKEVTINLSLSETNITLTTMSDGRGVGMKRINASGQMEMINTTQLNSTMAITMRFLRNSASCNVVEPTSDCEITSMDAKNFNPLKAMVAGKVNMEMKMTAANVRILFMNFDMFSAKQPPMESIMNENASSAASSATQVWQFGSLAPSNTYQYAIVSMPYSGSIINESADLNISAPLFYDENWNVIWNSSRGDNSANLTDDFIDYNSTLYQGYLLTTGLNCSKDDATLESIPCFMNTTSNIVYMRLPHFSGVGPSLIGSAVASPAGSADSPGSGGSTSSYWISTLYPSDAVFTAGYTQNYTAKQRVRVKVNNTDHFVGVISLTNSTATINVSSTPQQAVFNIGDEKKFDVYGNDSYYDLLVKLVAITNNKAQVLIQRISEKIETPIIPPITPPVTPQVNQTDQNNTASSNNLKEGLSNVTSSTWFWVVLVLILIVLVAGYFILFKRKRYYKHGY